MWYQNAWKPVLAGMVPESDRVIAKSLIGNFCLKTSSSSTLVDNVFKSIQVNASRAKTFDTFTNSTNRRWMSALSADSKFLQIGQTRCEPKAGSEGYDSDGARSSCSWGMVLLWEPPARFSAVWLIGGTNTMIDVSFKALAVDVTEVTLEHCALELLGNDAPRIQKALSNDWDKALSDFSEQIVPDRTPVVADRC